MKTSSRARYVKLDRLSLTEDVNLDGRRHVRQTMSSMLEDIKSEDIKSSSLTVNAKFDGYVKETPLRKPLTICMTRKRL